MPHWTTLHKFSTRALPPDRNAIKTMVNPLHPYKHVYEYEAVEGFWGFYRPVARGGTSPEMIIVDANSVLNQVGLARYVPE